MGLLAKSQKPLTATVQLLHPTRNYDDRQIVRMEITDATSRMQVVEVEMDAEQFLNLMRGAQATVTAAWSIALDRIGKEMENGQESWGAFPRADVSDAYLDALVETWRVKNGWDTANWHRNNKSEVIVIGRRWVEPGTSQQ